MIAFAAFVSVFYFLTLYMQNVVGFSPIRSGSAYLPVTAGIVVAAGISSQLFARIGTRPVIVAGALTAAAGVWYLSRIPVHGTYPASLLPGLVIMAIGIGAVLVSVTTAANAASGGQGRTRRRPAERLPATRHRPRPGDLLRHRHRPYQRAARRARPAGCRAYRGLPPRPARLRVLPARRRRHRAARHQQPRRAPPLSPAASRPPPARSPRRTGRLALVHGNPRCPAANRQSKSSSQGKIRRSDEVPAPDPLQRPDKVLGAVPAEEQKKVTAEFEAIRRSPGVLDGNQLQAASKAATVRLKNGTTQVTAGPAVEAGNELDGYYIYDAPGLDAATTSRRGSRSPGSAGPLRSARCSSVSDGQVPGARRGNRPHALHRRLRRRPVAALLRRRAGGEVLRDGEPSIVALANSWIIINAAGRPPMTSRR